MVVKNIIDGFNSTQELLKNPAKLQAIFRSMGEKTWGEIVETGDMLEILWKMSLNMDVTEEEKSRAYEQAKDLAKSIPAFGIFLLPGGMVLLPVIAKIIPWDIMPSQFSSKSNKNKPDENQAADINDIDKTKPTLTQ